MSIDLTDVVIVSGFAGSGKTTFIKQLTSGTLPPDITVSLPKDVINYCQIRPRNLIKMALASKRHEQNSAPHADAQQSPIPPTCILHYTIDKFQRMGFRDYRRDPLFAVIDQADRLLIVVIAVPQGQLLSQLADRESRDARRRGKLRQLRHKLVGIPSQRIRRRIMEGQPGPINEKLLCNADWWRTCFGMWLEFVESLIELKESNKAFFVSPVFACDSGMSFKLLEHTHELGGQARSDRKNFASE